jgi:hypothetical protein
VVASGAWSRATDADANAEVTPGLFTFVEQGTVNADSGWVLTTDGAIVVGTTALTFTQFSGAGQITAGAGLTRSGNTLDAVGTADRITVNPDSIDISSTYVGQTSITTVGTISAGTWQGTTVGVGYGGTGLSSYTTGDIIQATGSTTLGKLAAVATGNVLISGGVGTTSTWGKVGLTTHVSGTLAITNGGTGATSALTARSNLGVPTKYAAAVPAGSTTATITHNLNTSNVLVEVYEVATGITVLCDVTRSSDNAISLGFSVAPSANQYKVVVIGVEA